MIIIRPWQKGLKRKVSFGMLTSYYICIPIYACICVTLSCLIINDILLNNYKDNETFDRTKISYLL